LLEAARKVSVMDITIHYTFLPQNDPDAALTFYRDTLVRGPQRRRIRRDALDHGRPANRLAPAWC